MVPEDNAEDQTAAPTVAPVVAGATTVSGTAEPGADVTVELPNGETVTVAANDEGEWTATVPTVSLDDVLTVTALADGKTESLPVTVDGARADRGSTNRNDFLAIVKMAIQ